MTVGNCFSGKIMISLLYITSLLTVQVVLSTRLVWCVLMFVVGFVARTVSHVHNSRCPVDTLLVPVKYNYIICLHITSIQTYTQSKQSSSQKVWIFYLDSSQP